MTKPNIPLMDELVLVRQSNTEDWSIRRSAEELDKTGDQLLCWADGDSSKMSLGSMKMYWKHWRPLTREELVKIRVEAIKHPIPAKDELCEAWSITGKNWEPAYSTGKTDSEGRLLVYSCGRTSKTVGLGGFELAAHKWRPIPESATNREEDSQHNTEKSSPKTIPEGWDEMIAPLLPGRSYRRRNLDEQMKALVRQDQDWRRREPGTFFALGAKIDLMYPSQNPETKSPIFEENVTVTFQRRADLDRAIMWRPSR